MASKLALAINITAESAQARKALADISKNLQGIGARGKTAGAALASGMKRGENATKGLSSTLRDARNSLLKFVSAYAALRGLVGAIKIADEYKTLNARLKLVTDGQEAFNAAQQRLFDLSQRTRSSLTSTTELYARIALATKDAKVGQETLLGVTETLTQAVQLSGASAQEAQAGLIQLSQGLASGALRGDELRSVLEQLPGVADLIAKGMGKTRGELRELGEAGQLTAEAVIGAAVKMQKETAAAFGQLPLTVGQAMTQLSNSFTILVATFDEAGNATSSLAGLISDLATYLASNEVQGAIIEFAKIWSDALAQMVQDLSNAWDFFKKTLADITGAGEDMSFDLGEAFRQLPVNLRAAIQIAVVEILAFIDRMIARAKFAKEAVAAIFNDDTIAAAQDRYEKRIAAINGAAEQTVQNALSERESALRDADAARRDAEAKREAARKFRGSTSQGTFATKVDPKAAAKAKALQKAQLDAQEKLEKDSASRQLETLRNLFEDGQIAARDYYARRSAIQIEAIDREIAVEQKRAAAGGADRVKALAQIQILEREKQSIQEQSARELRKAQEGLDKELADLRIKDLEQSGKTAEAAKLKLEAEYKDTLRRLEAEGNTAGVELIKKIINTETARAQFADLEEQMNRAMSRLKDRQESLQAQALTGGISASTAAQQQSEARQAALKEVEALTVKMKELADATNDPRIVEGAQRASTALQQMAIDSATGVDKAIITLRSSLQQMNDSFLENAANSGVSAIEGFFNDIANGSKTAGEAFKDMVRNFALSLAQMAAKAIATNLVLKGLEMFKSSGGGGLGGIFGSLFGGGGGGGFLAGLFHRGGIVGAGGGAKMVNPWMFAGAPRFHAGGFPGLASNEVPAVLQKGEEVLSKADPRNAANGGGGGGTRIVNVIDPAMAGEYLNSSAGEQVILNIMRRNAGAVKQTLA